MCSAVCIAANSAFPGIAIEDSLCKPSASAWHLPCVIGTLISLKVVSVFTSLRVNSDDEREGLDIALHGEALHQ
jgi:hypothetical protein